jgi:hypothetical protein
MRSAVVISATVEYSDAILMNIAIFRQFEQITTGAHLFDVRKLRVGTIPIKSR